MGRPPTMDTDDDSFLQQRSNCAAFWGPFRPVFGGHTLDEAAGSVYLPTLCLALTRAGSAVLMLSTFLYYVLKPRYRLQFFSVWSHLLLGLSFALLASLSLLHAVQSRRLPGSTGKPGKLALAGVLLFQTAASAALFLDPVYWLLIYDGSGAEWPRVVQHAVNVALVVLDFALALRIEFRFAYIALFVLYLLVYLAFMWVYYAATSEFTYEFIDFRRAPALRVVGYYVGVLVWAVVAGVITVAFSRVGRLPCVRRKRTSAVDDGEASDFV